MKKITPFTILLRGIKLACPNCGRSCILRSWFHLHRRCPNCGMLLQRGEGAFLGAWVWNYGLTVFGVLPLVLLIWIVGMITTPTMIGSCLVLGVLCPALFYPLAWSLWLMTYYCFLPHELPANQTELIPVDEDE